MNYVALTDVATIQLGKMLSPKAKTGAEPFPYLRNQNVHWQRFELEDLATMDFSAIEREKFRLLPGDLLICEGGEPGRCAVWDGRIDGCYYQKALHRLRPKSGLSDSEFLALWIQFQAHRGAFNDQNAKTTIAHLPQVRLEQLIVPDIPLDEQIRIVTRLKVRLVEVEKARQAAETQQADVGVLRMAMFRQAFKQLVPVALPKNLPVAPTAWHWRLLTDIAQLESGHTPSRLRPDWWGGEISWVSLTEIRSLDGKWVEQTSIRTNEAGIANSSARLLPAGTVCFSRTASVGFVTIMAKPMATSQDFANWICGETLDPEFLMHALIASRPALRTIAEGATHKTIYMPALQSLHICVPSISEQRWIVNTLRQYLTSISELHESLQQQLSDLKALPQRILAQAFEN